MNPSPNCARLSLEAMPISIAIQSRTTITRPANSAVRRRNVKSPTFASRPNAKRSFDRGRISETSEWTVIRLEQLLAAGRKLLEASLDLRHDLGGQRGVVERFCELLSVVECPPQVLRDRLALGRVLGVGVDEQVRVTGDRIGRFCGRIDERDVELGRHLDTFCC